MKIGLVRHFQVDKDYLEGEIEAKEFSQWMREYDHHDVFKKEVDLRNINWNKCYASDLPRAVTTAETIYDGDIMKTSLIREVPMIFTEKFDKETRVKKGFNSWSIYSLLSWAKDNEEVIEETITMSRKRVNEFLDELMKNGKEDDNTLVVCHGMIMTVLEDELRKRGFSGERVIAAKNGELFLLEN